MPVRRTLPLCDLFSCHDGLTDGLTAWWTRERESGDPEGLKPTADDDDWQIGGDSVVTANTFNRQLTRITAFLRRRRFRLHLRRWSRFQVGNARLSHAWRRPCPLVAQPIGSTYCVTSLSLWLHLSFYVSPAVVLCLCVSLSPLFFPLLFSSKVWLNKRTVNWNYPFLSLLFTFDLDF